MNRITKAILSAFFAVLLLCGGLAIPSAAEEAVLFELNEKRNMAIVVSYENDPPEVSFIAPNGDEYGTEAITEGKMEFEDSGNALYFRIPEAMEGEWKIVYDKKNNSEIEVNCAPYAEPIRIESFTFAEGDRDGELDTKFTVTHGDSTEYYNYVIWAVITENGEIAGQTQLCEGSAKAGNETEVTVSLSRLNTYSDYSLMLEVYRDEYGAEVFDSVVSDETFSYTNENTPEPIEDFYVEVGVTDDYILMNWEDHYKYCEAYIVAIYAEGSDEPVYAAELDSSERATEVLVDLSVPSVTCMLAYKDSRGIISEKLTKKIDLEAARSLSFVCDEVTSASEGKVEYDFSSYDGPISVMINVNGKTEEARAEGQGSFSVKLDEYDNEISLKWFGEENMCFVVNAQVYSDRKAPILRLYEMTGDLVTEDKTFILTGNTDPGCTVTVGGNTAEVDDNGLFTITLELADGMNEFTVTATSKSGNSSKQVISIEKLAVVVDTGDAEGTLATILSYLPLIISFLVAAAVCTFVLLNSRSYSKMKAKNGKARAAQAAVRNVCIFIGVAAFICAVLFTVMTVKSTLALNSAEFIDAANESVSKANEMIETRDAWLIAMITAYAVLLVSVGIAVLCGWLCSEKRASAPKKPKPVRTARPTVPTGTSAGVDPSLKYCPKCGTQLPKQARFCGKCGHKFE